MQRILDCVDGILQKIIIGAMAFMLFFTFIQVVARYLFESSLVFSEELSRYLFVWTVFLGLPVVAKRGGHMAVTALSGRLKGAAARAMSIAAYLVGIAFMAGGIWGGIPGVLKATTGAHEVITTMMMNFIVFHRQRRMRRLSHPGPPSVMSWVKVLAARR